MIFSREMMFADEKRGAVLARYCDFVMIQMAFLSLKSLLMLALDVHE